MNVRDDSDYKIADAFASYLLTNSPKKTISSQKIDKRVLAIARYFFEQKLGLILMSEIRVESLEQFEIWAGAAQECGDIPKEAWGPNSILRHSKTLKTIFKKAFLTGRIQRDPSALWKLSAADPPPRKLITDEQFEKILSIAPDWYRPILRTLALTGQRPSSVARLKWADVDLDKGELYFTSRKGGRNREKRNAFPIFGDLRQILEDIPGLGEYVFLKDGLPVSGPLISITGHRLLKAADINGIHLYSLRHKFITDLIRSGASNEITRRLVGHANENQIKVYSKNLDIDALEKAVISIRGKNIS